MKTLLDHDLFCGTCFQWRAGSGNKAVPPPPKPADEGPSLEVTMKFIQDKLNDIGPVTHGLFS